jgi:zinc protease
MESDRWAISCRLTEAKFINQRDVLNERRQNYENRPYGLASMALVDTLYPSEHPYSWLTIGAAEDLRASSLDEVRTFFQTYYHPANASLTIAGDIRDGDAIELARKYFEEIPGSPYPPEVKAAEATITAEQRLLLEDRVELPRIYMAWHAPALFEPGDAELDLVAEMLAGGKTSRLYRALVYETRTATEIAASQNSRELSSFFQVVATAAPGRMLAEVERIIRAEIDKFITHGPEEAELERAMAQAEVHFVQRLQTVGGFGGKSDQLNAYNTFLGSPDFFAADLDRYRKSTRESIRAAAAKYLSPSQRVILSVVPRGRLALAIPDSRPVSVS